MDAVVYRKLCQYMALTEGGCRTRFSRLRLVGEQCPFLLQGRMPSSGAVNVEGAPYAVHDPQGQPAADNDAQAAAKHVGASEPGAQETEKAQANCSDE